MSIYFQPNLQGNSEQSGYGKRALILLAWAFGREDMFSGDNSSIESNIHYQTIYFFSSFAAYTQPHSYPTGVFITGLVETGVFSGLTFLYFFS